MRPLPLFIRPDLRFACHRCGDCCRSYVVTVDADEERRLAAQGWWRRGLRFLGGVVTDGHDPWGRPARVLRRRPDGRCILLDDDGLCLVHKRFGHAAKPHVCRQFPLVFVRAPDALRVAITSECTSRHKSVADGPALEATREEIAALAAAVTPYRTHFRVRLSDAGPLLSAAGCADLEQRILDAIRAGPLTTGLIALARVPDAFARAASGQAASAPAACEQASRASDDTASTETSVDAVLATMLPVVEAHADDPGRAPLARAAGLLAAPGAWRDALAACERDPAASLYLRAVVCGWIDEAIPAREPTAEDGVGRLLLGALCCAAPALAPAPDPDLPAAMNAVARVLSLAFRGERGARLRADLPPLARLRRAVADAPAAAT